MSVIYYVIVDEEGAIVGHGTAHSEAEARADGEVYGAVYVGHSFEGADPERHYLVDGSLRSYPPRPHAHATFDFASEQWSGQDLDAARIDAQKAVEIQVGRIRAAYITVIPGQEMTYSDKRAAALAFMADAAPTAAVYPQIYGEVGITGATAQEVAGTILAQSDAWTNISAILEPARLAASVAIKQAASLAEIDAALQAFNTNVENL